MSFKPLFTALEAVQALCRERDILFMIDEVQTGMCRTGRFWAFQNYGLNPGPQLFQTSGPLVWALIASLYIGNVMLLVLNLPLVGLWVKLLKVPKPQLYAGIMIFATVGAYGMRQSAFDLFLLYGIGILGLVMRRFNFPTAPVLVGMILGPLAEAQMRNAISIGEGSALIFFQRPMSLAIMGLVVLILTVPRVLKWHSERLR